MQTWHWTTLLGTILVATLAGVAEAGIERSVVGGTETIECKGESVEVNGAASDFTLLGDCPHVEVNGANNTVRIERAKQIDIHGMGNRVIWERGPNGGRPSIDMSGFDNSASQGRVAPAKDAAPVQRSGPTSPVVIASNGQTQTIACAGNDVTVDGNSNKLSLTGECGRVEVNGNGNVVRVEAAAAISALGNKNTVTWSRGAGAETPQLTNLGSANDISRAHD